MPRNAFSEEFDRWMKTDFLRKILSLIHKNELTKFFSLEFFLNFLDLLANFIPTFFKFFIKIYLKSNYSKIFAHFTRYFFAVV